MKRNLRKKAAVVLMAIIMCVSLMGCNLFRNVLESDSNKAVAVERPEESEAVSEAVSEELSEETQDALEEADSEVAVAEEPESTEEEESEPYYEPEVKNISEDSGFVPEDPVRVEGEYEFGVESVQYVTKVVAAQAGDFTLKFDVVPGNVFIDCVFLYTNLSDQAKGATKIVDGYVEYADKFLYENRRITVEEADRSDLCFSISETVAAGESRYVHCFFEVPEEVIRGNGRIIMVLEFGDESYELVVKEGDDADTLGIVPNGAVSENGVIEVGGMYATETAEFGVEYAEFKQKVEPPRNGPSKDAYEAAEGMVYLDLCIPYRNFGEKKILAEDIFEASLLYENNTEYEGFSIVESESRTDFTYSNIVDMQPLMQGYIHMLFEVPQTVAESGSVQVTIMMDGESYVLTLR